MSRTLVPAFSGYPVTVPLERVMEVGEQLLREYQGDCDKSDTTEDNCYYQGGVDALYSLLLFATFPQTQETARECVHGNQVWFGHECGECEAKGYEWLAEDA